MEYMEVFKRLHAEFLDQLEEQRNILYCKHVSEIMHVICQEKTNARNKISTINWGTIYFMIHFKYLM